MNILLSYYIDQNTVTNWKDKFSGAGQKVIMYKFKSTNGRNLNSYEEKFKKMCEVEGLERSKWKTYDNGQQVHKQYTVPMIESKLFYKKDDKYLKTAKGLVYEKYLKEDFNDDEKWLINYILLLDSTMSDTENYLVNRSLEINDILVENTSEEFVDKACRNIFAYRNEFKNQSEVAYYDYLYLNSFYLEPSFLKQYFEASDSDREEFKNYVSENWKLRNKKDCVSKKFVSTNYSVPELIDDLKIFMYSLQIHKIKYSNFDTVVKRMVEIYSADYDVNSEILLNFLFNNRDIVEPILMNVYKVEDMGDIIDEEEGSVLQEDVIVDTLCECDRPEPRIDDTTISGKKQLDTIFSIRKKIARELSDYTCALSEYKDCRYFTSKTTKRNYVEVHHLIPRGFRNKFEYSLDVLANYITLCPHCHRLIHNATDRERLDVIKYIFNKRKDRLKNCGLEVEVEELLTYYNVQEIY